MLEWQYIKCGLPPIRNEINVYATFPSTRLYLFSGSIQFMELVTLKYVYSFSLQGNMSTLFPTKEFKRMTQARLRLVNNFDN